MAGPDDRRRESSGGIPDGLLIGILLFLIGVTFLAWWATGLAAALAHGRWPEGVTFARTPQALRHLLGEPTDIQAAWPTAPADALPGHTLFWTLFGVHVVLVLTLAAVVLTAYARWKARRAAVKAARATGASPRSRTPRRVPGSPEPAGAASQPPSHKPAPDPASPDLIAHEHTPQRGAPRTAVPPAQEPAIPVPGPAAALPEAVPTPRSASPGLPVTSGAERLGAPPAERLVVAPREERRAAAVQAVRDAEGAAVVVTSNPAVWSETKDARSKLGPVHLYDPTHLCDTPARLHWSPTAGCEDKATAAARAAALLSPVRPTARIDQAVADVAETLLRSCLHAAAVDGRTIRHVHRWAQGNQIQDAVRILRTNPRAASGTAGELEAALTAHPERRDIAQELTGRALSSLFTVHVREACTPNRADALALDSFVDEGGTLYVVGESIEDPRTNPGAMPLLTALVSSVVERGRRMAERSSAGRLDPPLTFVLDDVAAVAPLPELPRLLSAGTDEGLPVLALLRSREQARARWPHAELPA